MTTAGTTASTGDDRRDGANVSALAEDWRNVIRGDVTRHEEPNSPVKSLFGAGP